MARHLDCDHTLKRPHKWFLWPGITQDVAEYCRNCQKMSKRGPKAPMVPMSIIGEPFEMDVIGPLPRTFINWWWLQFILHVVITDSSSSNRENDWFVQPIPSIKRDFVWPRTKLHGWASHKEAYLPTFPKTFLGLASFNYIHDTYWLINWLLLKFTSSCIKVYVIVREIEQELEWEGVILTRFDLNGVHQ